MFNIEKNIFVTYPEFSTSHRSDMNNSFRIIFIKINIIKVSIIKVYSIKAYTVTKNVKLLESASPKTTSTLENAISSSFIKHSICNKPIRNKF